MQASVVERGGASEPGRASPAGQPVRSAACGQWASERRVAGGSGAGPDQAHGASEHLAQLQEGDDGSRRRVGQRSHEKALTMVPTHSWRVRGGGAGASERPGGGSRARGKSPEPGRAGVSLAPPAADLGPHPISTMVGTRRAQGREKSGRPPGGATSQHRVRSPGPLRKMVRNPVAGSSAGICPGPESARCPRVHSKEPARRNGAWRCRR